jgi:Ni,Fe-hydrogenase III large subunit
LKKLEEFESEQLQVELSQLQSNSFVVSMTEGWRGEVVHMAMTDDNGKLSRYKIKDPSFNNWFALAMAVRNNGISDFPLCNKSFNLSYCGNDL